MEFRVSWCTSIKKSDKTLDPLAKRPVNTRRRSHTTGIKATCFAALHNISTRLWSYLEYLNSPMSLNYSRQQFTLVLTTCILLSGHLFFIGQTCFWYPSTSLSPGSHSTPSGLNLGWLAKVQFTVVFKKALSCTLQKKSK